MKITRFEDLNCWQDAVALATEIYQISNQGEFAKDFGLRDQLRRAAVSISSNIAEELLEKSEKISAMIANLIKVLKPGRK